MENYTWSTSNAAIDLENLFQPDKKFCFLAGSGVSLLYPSCRPTGFQFSKKLSSFLSPANQQQRLLDLINQQFSAPGQIEKFLRFEQLMEYVQEWDPDLHILDSYAFCKGPNVNHLTLARFITTGHKVFTTNFDNLIEYALSANGIDQKAIKPVIFKSDWESAADKNAHAVYKLHGSLTDYRNQKDSRSSLQATIRQIANHKGETFLLENWKAKVFESALIEEDLVVVGYSGLDDFDILPTIKAADSSFKCNRFSFLIGRLIELNRC